MSKKATEEKKEEVKVETITEPVTTKVRTMAEAAEVMAILERPFSPELIKQRTIGGGKSVDYVETVYYIERLTEAFGHAWDFCVKSYEIRQNDCLCIGQLSYPWDNERRVKEAFGSKDTVSKAGNSMGEMGDMLKSAGSDALKKACSLLGIGKDLYKKPLNIMPPAPQQYAPPPQYNQAPRQQYQQHTPPQQYNNVPPQQRQQYQQAPPPQNQWATQQQWPVAQQQVQQPPQVPVQQPIRPVAPPPQQVQQPIQQPPMNYPANNPPIPAMPPAPVVQQPPQQFQAPEEDMSGIG